MTVDMFRLKITGGTQSEVGAMKSAAAVNVSSDLREKRRKIVDVI